MSETRKIAINTVYGGFSLSERARRELEKLGAPQKLSRDDPRLIDVIERIGPKASSGPMARIKVVEIPADVAWDIEEYDGIEWVAESHRTWS